MPWRARVVAHCPESVDLGDVAGDLGDDPDADAEKEAGEERGMKRVRLGVGIPARTRSVLQVGSTQARPRAAD